MKKYTKLPIGSSTARANPDFNKKIMALQDINLEEKKGERLGIINITI